MTGDGRKNKRSYYYVVFFFNETATTEIYTLSLHDALPICNALGRLPGCQVLAGGLASGGRAHARAVPQEILNFSLVAVGLRSEEHTSELQSRQYLVCRLLLEKKSL